MLITVDQYCHSPVSFYAETGLRRRALPRGRLPAGVGLGADEADGEVGGGARPRPPHPGPGRGAHRRHVDGGEGGPARLVEDHQGVRHQLL